jgi:hypothetical protein
MATIMSKAMVITSSIVAVTLMGTRRTATPKEKDNWTIFGLEEKSILMICDILIFQFGFRFY